MTLAALRCAVGCFAVALVALVAGREAPAVWWFAMAVALTWWAAATVEETEE